MKKLLMALLIAVMVLSLVACDKNKDETPDINNDEVVAENGDENTNDASETIGDGEETNTDAEEYVPFDYASADLSEYIEIGNYEGLTYTPIDTELGDEEFIELINEGLASNPASEHITDRPVAEGDTVVIDYTGALEGEKFDGGTASGVEVIAAEGTGYIPGFATALIGHSAGDEFAVDITFPDPYPNNADFSGKVVTFLFYIHYIKGEEIIYTVDTLDDNYVYDNFNFDTVENFLKTERETYAIQKSYFMTTEMYNEIWAQVLNNCEIKKYPAGEVEYYFNTYKEMYEYYAEYYGMDYDTFLKEQVGQTEADILRECQTMVKDNLALNAIAKELDAVVTDEDVENKIVQFGIMYGAPSDQIVSYFGEETMKSTAQFDKIMEIIFGYSTPVEASTEDVAE